MKRILEKYAGLDNLIELYVRPDDVSRFDAGWVLGVDENCVLMLGLDEMGRRDGLMLRMLKNVVSVQEDTLYLKKLKRLSARYIPDKSGMPMPRGGMMEWIMRYALDGRLGISLELADSGCTDICGQIENIGRDVLTVRQLDAWGEEDGIAYVPFERITRVDCDGADERCRLYLAGK